VAKRLEAAEARAKIKPPATFQALFLVRLILLPRPLLAACQSFFPLFHAAALTPASPAPSKRVVVG
jgi:hypothetical protein